MNSILLQKEDHYLSDPNTDRQIPFLFKGDGAPSFARISTEPISAELANAGLTAAQLGEIGEEVSLNGDSVVNEWDEQLTRDSFTGSKVHVAGVDVVTEKAQRMAETPATATWDGFSVSKIGDTQNMRVSGYSRASHLQTAAGDISYPWKASWDEMSVEPLAGLGMRVRLLDKHLMKLHGAYSIEPTDRSWTSGFSFTAYSSSIYSPGVYDLKDQNGLIYRIVDEDARGTDRVWTGGGYAVRWNGTSKRWERVSYSGGSYGAVSSYQYLEPFSTSWLYATEVSSDAHRLRFDSVGTIVNQGTSVLENGWGDSAVVEEGVGDVTVRGTAYTLFAENAVLEGVWTSGVTAALNADGDLVVSGFSNEDVNGLYALFYGSGDTRIWLHSGNDAKYSIKKAGEGKWELRTTTDGQYLQDGVGMTLATRSGSSNLPAEGKYADQGYVRLVSHGTAYTFTGGAMVSQSATLYSAAEVYGMWGAGEGRYLPAALQEYYYEAVSFEGDDIYYYVGNGGVLQSASIYGEESYESLKTAQGTLYRKTQGFLTASTLTMQKDGYTYRLEYHTGSWEISRDAIPARVKTGVYRVWTDAFSTASHRIFYSRYSDCYQLKACRALELTFTGSADSWTCSNSFYTMEYISEAGLWRLKEIYSGNALSYSSIEPNSWMLQNTESETIVSLSEGSVTNTAQPYGGSYAAEDFDPTLHPLSLAHSNNASSDQDFYVTFNFGAARWEILEFLDADGDYAVVDATQPMKSRVWQKASSIYEIGFDAGAGAWRLYDSGDSSVTHAQSGLLGVSASPVEADWGVGNAVTEDGDDVTVAGFGGYRAAAGGYEKEGDTWQRAVTGYGTYIFARENGAWHLRFVDSRVNGDYIKNASTGKNAVWTCSDGESTPLYRMKWDADGECWRIVAAASEAMEIAASSPYDLITSGWAGATVALRDDGSVTVSGASDADMNGVYAPVAAEATYTHQEWGLYVSAAHVRYTLRYDLDALRWVIVATNQDANDYYSPMDSSAGRDRKWRLETATAIYTILWSEAESRWELARGSGSGRVVLSYCADDDPFTGSWSLGEVSNPFADAEVYQVFARFTPVSKQTYDINVQIENAADAIVSTYSGIYTLVDSEATGGSRVWKNGNGGFVKYVKNRNGDAYLWVMTSDEEMTQLTASGSPDPMMSGYADTVCATASQTNNPGIADPSTLTWSKNYALWSDYSGVLTLTSSLHRETGTRQLWLLAGTHGQDGLYHTSNIVTFYLTVLESSFSNVSFRIYGSSGSEDYTGFYRDPATGRFIPTDLVTIRYSAACDYEMRLSFSGGIVVPGVNEHAAYDKSGIQTTTCRLPASTLGGADIPYTFTMEARDIAGNRKPVTASIVHISRLWRMLGTHIKQDDAAYSTAVYELTASDAMRAIPRTKSSDSEFTRSWRDIFYPATHGYPTLENGEIDVEEAKRISKDNIDETGATGPTTEELSRYDQLVLSADGNSLTLDGEGRPKTRAWQTDKTYGRMESSSYGVAGEGMRYWVIDNSGYNGIKLEFEYFDLSNQVSTTPPNLAAPHRGDTLVVYDAQAEGCVEETMDEYGRISYRLLDTSKLVELYAFGGSHYTDDIALKTDSAAEIERQDCGFTIPAITSTSRICLILYTDNDYQRSGFKLKAGPRHAITYYNYDMSRETGELWVHRHPGTASSRWNSPNRVATTHQYMTTTVAIDYEHGVLTLSDRSGATITGSYAVCQYLPVGGAAQPPVSYFAYDSGGTPVHRPLTTFLLSNDDLVDYYDAAISVSPEGIAPDWTNIYSYTNILAAAGKVTSGYELNKDRGVVTFRAGVPLGRLFGSYTYHSYYRLTNDGYGDLFFYDNSLVPSGDRSTTGLPDWTYVDLMICNEGGNSLSEGLLKFLSRGYVAESSGSAAITQVVDENRPWDVQSGTVAETINRTGAVFSQTYSGLAARTRGAAVAAINSTAAGGVSLGGVLAPRSRAYLRVYWCLALDDTSSAKYVTTTRGAKLWSSEISGKYFVVTT